jgi:hypothetical protein
MLKLALVAIAVLGCSSSPKSTAQKNEPPAPAKREPTPEEQRQKAIDDARKAGIEAARLLGVVGESTDGSFGTLSDTGDSDLKTGDDKVTLGHLSSAGDLDKAIIRRYIKQHLPQIKACYEKELASKPKLSGTVSTQFIIGGDGKVSAVSGSGLPPVDACVAAVIVKVVFPAPKGGGNVQVNYPFVFHP